MTAATATVLDARQHAQFDELGFVRVERAFDTDAARAMCDVIWGELARTGVRSSCSSRHAT